MGANSVSNDITFYIYRNEKSDCGFLEVNHKPRDRVFWVRNKLTESQTEVALKVIKDGSFAACIYAIFMHELKNWSQLFRRWIALS